MTSYWNYLALDTILDSQAPITQAHDEPLFIIIHQAFELWFKLLIRELRMAIACMARGDATQAAHYMHRVNVILNTSAQGFDVMDTMTPEAFREFRDSLVPASGTQSFQFRELELLCGMPKLRTVSDQRKYYWEDTPNATLTLQQFWEKYGDRLKSVEDEVAANGSLRSTFSALVLKSTGATDLVEAAENATGSVADLVQEVRSFDESMILWRDKHVSTTKHAIGDSPGTAMDINGQMPSTACVDYLKSTITAHERLLFPEFHQG